MKRKRLVLFVEGEGDQKAVPVLVKRLLTEARAWDKIILDPDPFKVRSHGALAKDNYESWTNKLRAAAKRSNVGGVLLVLDGDEKSRTGEVFCARRAAAELATRAHAAGGGKLFSVAVVFALQEYESWLIAGVKSLAGRPLSGNLRGVLPGTAPPDGDLEASPREAKEWLSKFMPDGYKPTTHQQPLSEIVDIATIRERHLRSFRRFENAVRELVTAMSTADPICTPHNVPASN